MKLIICIFLTCLYLAGIDAQRTRIQNSAETDTSAQSRGKARGRVRFSLPIDVDAELADIPSKAIRPESRFEPRTEARTESKPTPIVRKIKITSTPKSAPYEVEEIVEDIPDKTFRKPGKARVITETRFEAAHAPKKPFFEAFPRPEDEISSEDFFSSFAPQITKSTTEKITENKKELVEQSVQQKELKKSRNNVKGETIKEEKISLNEETITVNKEVQEEDNVSRSSSVTPESTTSSEVSSTENEIKKEVTSPANEEATKAKTSRTRPQVSQTPSTEEPASKVRTRGRARPQATSAEITQTVHRTRSRTRTPSAESAELPSRSRSYSSVSEFPSRGRISSSESSEVPTRVTRVRGSRRRSESSEEVSSTPSRGRGPSVFVENSQEGPSRIRTGRKVNYPVTDNVSQESESKPFTVRSRKIQNSVKTEENQRIPSRGRSGRGSQRTSESAEVPRTNSRRTTVRRKVEVTQAQTIPSRKPEIKVEEKKNEPIPTSSTTTTTSTTSSTTSTERTSRRNAGKSQRGPSPSASTNIPSRISRGRPHKKINADSSIEKKPEVPTSSERKALLRSRQRSRFVPPVIDEQKLEVLPLFESEAKTVEPIIKKQNSRESLNSPRDNEVKSKTSNEIITIVKPQIKERIEVHTSKPIVKVETKVSEVVSTRRIVRKRKKDKNENPNNDPKKSSNARGQKKADLTQKLNTSEEDVGESDNYPEAFKALIHAKSKENKQSSRTRSSEERSTKKATAEKVVTVQRSSSSTSSTTNPPRISLVKYTPKVNEEDNNIVPTSTASTTRGTRRKFSLATKPPGFEESQTSSRPNGRKPKPNRSTVAPSLVSVVTEVSQSAQTQPKYHARFISSSTTEGIANSVFDEQSVSTTPKVKVSTKTPRGLYSSRKGNGKKKERKNDGTNQQQQPLGVKKKNRYSARYRSDIVSRPGSTRPTTAPVYIPTVPTVTPSYDFDGSEAQHWSFNRLN